MHLFPRLTALVKDTIVTTRLISRHCQKSTFLQWGTYGALVKSRPVKKIFLVRVRIGEVEPEVKRDWGEVKRCH